MKQIIFWMLPILCASFFFACDKDTPAAENIEEKTVYVDGRRLSVYLHDAGTPYVAVFESGLGDGVLPWRQKQVMEQTAVGMSVIGYDRAGYLDSEAAGGPRDIPALRSDLEKLLNSQFPGKKFLLISHSLGALTIRDFAVHHPDQTAALLFVDPTHEAYNAPDEALEDLLVNAFGASTGAGMEARQLVEDIQYAKTMTTLPDKPCTVITSMQITAENNAEDRLKWYDAHEKLGTGLSRFLHLKTTSAGHYIHREAPDLVLHEIEALKKQLQ